MRYKGGGSAEMTVHPMVRAVVSPLESMVWDSSVIVVSAGDAHPVQEIESNSTLPGRCHSSMILGAADGDAQEG